MEGMSLGHFSVIHLILAGQSLNCDHELASFINDPFAPEQSHVARKFCPRIPNTLAITQGNLVNGQW